VQAAVARKRCQWKEWLIQNGIDVIARWTIRGHLSIFFMTEGLRWKSQFDR